MTILKKISYLLITILILFGISSSLIAYLVAINFKESNVYHWDREGVKITYPKHWYINSEHLTSGIISWSQTEGEEYNFKSAGVFKTDDISSLEKMSQGITNYKQLKVFLPKMGVQTLIRYDIKSVAMNNTQLDYKAYGIIKIVNGLPYIWYILDPSITEYINLIATSFLAKYE